MVRAKFRVNAIRNVAAYNSSTHETTFVELVPAAGDANKTWSKWTPSGKLEMQINNPEALKQFELGACYFLDFTPAPEREADESP